MRRGLSIAEDRAIRDKHEQRLLADIDKLSRRIANKRLVKPENINQAIGRLKERYPRAPPLAQDRGEGADVQTRSRDE